MSTAAAGRATRATEGSLGERLAGKYMTFKLADEVYGLEILKVREIIGVMEVTRMPRAPEFVSGIINLRGKVIPVVDLRVKFGMPRTERTDQTVIIVVQYALGDRSVTMGLLVDEVLEVLSVEAAQIEPPPSFAGDSVDLSFLLGIGKAEARVIFLVEIGYVLSEAEASALAEAVATH